MINRNAFFISFLQYHDKDQIHIPMLLFYGQEIKITKCFNLHQRLLPTETNVKANDMTSTEYLFLPFHLLVFLSPGTYVFDHI
jgi:hypothetical protein